MKRMRKKPKQIGGGKAGSAGSNPMTFLVERLLLRSQKRQTEQLSPVGMLLNNNKIQMIKYILTSNIDPKIVFII